MIFSCAVISTMAQTTALIATHLPVNICKIVISFFPNIDTDTLRNVMIYGLREDLQNIPWSEEALDISCSLNNIQLVEQILSKAPRNTKLYFDDAAIFAVDNRSLEIIKLLYRNGPLYISNRPYIHACEKGYLDIVKFLKTRQQCLDTHLIAICAAIRHNHQNVFDYLWQNISYKYSQKNTIMYSACEYGMLNIAVIVSREYSDDYDNILCRACQNGHTNIVARFYHKRKINNLRFVNVACEHGQLDVIEFLLRNGAATLNQIFGFACYHNNLPIMRYLAHNGANKCDCDRLFADHL
jgi:ankyrin repeat protein